MGLVYSLWLKDRITQLLTSNGSLEGKGWPLEVRTWLFWFVEHEMGRFCWLLQKSTFSLLYTNEKFLDRNIESSVPNTDSIKL